MMERVAKTELRETFARMRDGFTGDARREADDRIAGLFLGSFSGRESFFVYFSFGGETSTRAIIDGLEEVGKRVYLPKMEGGVMRAAPNGETAPGLMGIPEPEAPACDVSPEVAVVPLLAVDRDGFRLGRGGGHYDRYLRGRDVLKVGIGYSFQLADSVPADEWDVPLDAFVCEKGIYRFGGGRGFSAAAPCDDGGQGI